MGFVFGTNSKKRLSTCHSDIQKVLNLAITRSKVDFGLSEGERSIERQQELYAIGRTVNVHKRTVTNVDGVVKKGKHNHSPSLAVDIYVWHDNPSTRKQINYDEAHLSYVAGVIDSCAAELNIDITWGGNWDNDGIIKFDQGLNDMPHFQI